MAWREKVRDSLNATRIGIMGGWRSHVEYKKTLG